ncbi:MAG: hypothetical protein JO029_09560 [Candidatus Eremiobacteraeota bacterium]|nr:hypothetical protein [Candidatus Eremiobacteraeota bacterium]
MKRLAGLAFALAIVLGPQTGAAMDDVSRIQIYVTPYYNSDGPAIAVGPYSAGLASRDSKQFVTTVHTMKKHWMALRFYELYAAAIRLYDLGYRNESVYWFYTAQYRGRQLAVLMDQDRLGSMGSPGFELYHAQDAFFQLVGPYVNGYAFGDPDALLRVVRRVQSENRTVGNLASLYPGVAFVDKSQWAAQNDRLNSGMNKLADALTTQKDAIRQQRQQTGADAKFGRLTSKDLPG